MCIVLGIPFYIIGRRLRCFFTFSTLAGLVTYSHENGMRCIVIIATWLLARHIRLQHDSAAIHTSVWGDQAAATLFFKSALDAKRTLDRSDKWRSWVLLTPPWPITLKTVDLPSHLYTSWNVTRSLHIVLNFPCFILRRRLNIIELFSNAHLKLHYDKYSICMLSTRPCPLEDLKH